MARIAAVEIGLPAECIAAVFLHEASSHLKRRQAADNLQGAGTFEKELDAFGNDIRTMVDGLDKIATIKPKDTRLEAENYKKLIVSYARKQKINRQTRKLKKLQTNHN